METTEAKAKLTDGPDAFGPAWKAETMRYSKVELVELYKLALLLLLPVRQDLDDAVEVLKAALTYIGAPEAPKWVIEDVEAVITKAEGRAN